jgi:hypothetical protein
MATFENPGFAVSPRGVGWNVAINVGERVFTAYFTGEQPPSDEELQYMWKVSPKMLLHQSNWGFIPPEMLAETT